MYKILLMISLAIFTASASEKNNIYATASASGNFKILLAAVDAAGLSEVLKAEGELTVLAPTDQAFGRLAPGTVEDLLKPENKQKLIDILKFHVISGVFKANDLFAEELYTLQGQSLKTNVKDGQLFIDKAKIIANDISTSNGVIHVIDQVLLPQAEMANKEKMTKLIESAIEKGVRLYNSGEHQSCVDVYSLALESLLYWNQGTFNKDLKKSIKRALSESKNHHKADNNAWALRKLLNKAYGVLSQEMETKKMSSSFKPIIESNLPKGFPEPGPVNQVVLKEYPAYRAAQADSSGQSSTFMKLFYHIKKSGISMTAPVEMQLDTEGQSRKNMAFLYANQNIGSTGEKGNGVEVVDLPAQAYLSIGIRGSESKQKIAEAIEKIEAYLLEKNQWEVTGEPRLLGYNSPMVPRENRYWEVQLPVSSK